MINMNLVHPDRTRRIALASLPALVGAIFLAFSWGADPVSAQTAQPANGPVCMARGDLSVILPARDVAALAAKGFTIEPCSKAFATEQSVEKWRDEVCLMAATLNSDVQDTIEQRAGERPAVLCGMAEEVVGAWQQGESE